MRIVERQSSSKGPNSGPCATPALNQCPGRARILPEMTQMDAPPQGCRNRVWLQGNSAGVCVEGHEDSKSPGEGCGDGHTDGQLPLDVLISTFLLPR